MNEKNESDNQKGKSYSPVIIKRGKKHHAHHGGSWKIAYADFVTAMMAFFLLLWLLASLNTAQKKGLADFFKQPIKAGVTGGESMGNREINIQGGGDDIERSKGQVSSRAKAPVKSTISEEAIAQLAKEQEIKQLEQLKSNITLSMRQDSALSGLEDHMLMDIVSDGLRIQLIDNKNKPMFDIGSDKMHPEMELILNKIARLLNSVPNKLSTQGHTDAHPYHNPEELEFTNWELSTQRANTARRYLVKAGMQEDKVLRVSGYSSTILLDKKNPLSPNNRRISIIVMKKHVEDKLLQNK